MGVAASPGAQEVNNKYKIKLLASWLSSYYLNRLFYLLTRIKTDVKINGEK
jgi:hypothetical protein